eukprot:1668880-Pyramimonas_sp.AAC.1
MEDLIKVHKTPASFPATRPIGPGREVVTSWGAAMAALGETEGCQEALANGFAAFMQGAEEELGSLFHIPQDDMP